MSRHVRLTLETIQTSKPLIKLIQRHIGKSKSELRQAVASQHPLLDERPLDHLFSDFIASTTKLIDDLDAAGIAYRVEIDGVPKSPQCLRDVFTTWHDLSEEFLLHEDLNP
jgi:hypothetical protein